MEALPGAAHGGAFRGGAEPIVAERVGLRAVERLRLFWHSDPDHPFGRTAERVVVTPQHVYVVRRDGTKARVALDQLHGERLDRGRVIYGVRDGDDLLLSYRDDCAVQVRLAAAVRGADPVEPWRGSYGLWSSIVLSVMAWAVGGLVYVSHPIGEAIDRVSNGLYFAESVLGTLAAFGMLAFGTVVFLWAPSRWRIDAVAVTRARGVVPWLSFSVPPDRFRRAVLKDYWLRPKNGAPRHSGWWVGLELRTPTRVGSIGKVSAVDLWFVRRDQPGTPTISQRSEALDVAERLRRLLGLEPTRGG